MNVLFRLATIGLVLIATVGRVPADDRPNLVFLLTDDQATYSLGCYGNPDVRTPNIDRLAAEGMVFDRHYDTTAICMASRASIFTGLHEYRTGCNFEHGNLVQEKWDRSYPVLLRKAGYRTALAGKFGVEISPRPDAEGRLPIEDFNRWGGGPGQTHYATKKNESMVEYADEYPHSTLAYGAFGRDFIRESTKGDEPFCLSISFKAPHRPTTPDPRFDDVYAGKTFAKPANYGREHGRHFSEQSRQGRQYVRFEEWGYADNYDAVMATYHQQVHGIDAAVGMIRDAIADSGAQENTVVVFTSDNGFLCGSHGYGSKVLPYEEASRVPLILYLPGRENTGKGLRCGALTGNVDFHPTLLELAGIAPPEGIDGRSLLPLYHDPSASIREQLPLINVYGPKETHSLAVVTADWKYVHWPYDEGAFEATEELYFIGEDPLELENLAADPAHRSQLDRMRKRYDREVGSWRERAVPFHGYHPYGAWFRRKGE
ncbi:MAG: sulfatase [Verrucomicrobiales bacterium]